MTDPRTVGSGAIRTTPWVEPQRGCTSSPLSDSWGPSLDCMLRWPVPKTHLSETVEERSWVAKHYAGMTVAELVLKSTCCYLHHALGCESHVLPSDRTRSDSANASSTWGSNRR